MTLSLLYNYMIMGLSVILFVIWIFLLLGHDADVSVFFSKIFRFMKTHIVFSVLLISCMFIVSYLSATKDDKSSFKESAGNVMTDFAAAKKAIASRKATILSQKTPSEWSVEERVHYPRLFCKKSLEEENSRKKILSFKKKHIEDCLDASHKTIVEMERKIKVIDEDLESDSCFSFFRKELTADEKDIRIQERKQLEKKIAAEIMYQERLYKRYLNIVSAMDKCDTVIASANMLKKKLDLMNLDNGQRVMNIQVVDKIQTLYCCIEAQEKIAE